MRFTTRATLAVMTALASITLGVPAAADITLGQATQYVVMGYNINLHNTDVFGNVGVGYDTVSGTGKMSVGGPSIVHGTVYRDPQATVTGSIGPINLENGIVVQPLAAAFADAMSAYNAAIALVPDVTITGNVSTDTEVVATHGGQYVVRITGSIGLSDNNNLILTPALGLLTTFIVQLDGTLTLGGSSIVGAATSDGAASVLIVARGTGNTMTSHVDNIVNGTLLAPFRSASFHGFNGALIAGKLEAKLMSDCQVHHVCFMPPADCNRNGIPDSTDIANGALDADRDGIPDACQPGTTRYCFGDGSTNNGGIDCPCGNNSPAGSESGCLNRSGIAAFLATSGLPSISNDTLRLTVSGLNPASAAVFFAGTQPRAGGNGVPFGNGLMCVGGTVQRVRKLPPSGFGGATVPKPGGPSLSVVTSAAAGETAHFQVMYRDPTGPCGQASNTSNAVSVVWGL